MGALAFAFFLTLFYTPCRAWEPLVPCTWDPPFLGWFHWPRGLHDLMLEWKTVVVLTLVASWFGMARRSAGEERTRL